MKSLKIAMILLLVAGCAIKSQEEMRLELTHGQPWSEPITGMAFAWIEGGCFEMGLSVAQEIHLMEYYKSFTIKKTNPFTDELPQHQVCLDGFWMGRYEVTVGQFRRFVQETGYLTWAEKWGGCCDDKNGMWVKNDETWRKPGFDQEDTHPVTCISWSDARHFAYWLSKQTGKVLHLPTEAQWEYAARGGTTTLRPWGDTVDGSMCNYANYDSPAADISWRYGYQCDDGYINTAPVGLYKPNGYGLYDMFGNVLEWCHDWYSSDYFSRSPSKNPTGPEPGSDRVLRGSSWRGWEESLRSTSRFQESTDSRFNFLGFRLVLRPVSNVKGGSKAQ